MSDILATGRALAEGQYEGGGFKGRKNAYECDGTPEIKGHSPAKPGCGAFIVTIDIHPGVTPFMLDCGRCGGWAHSKFYRVADWLEPTHEWYRPDTLEGINPAYLEHLSKGGLILRPIGKDEWSVPPGWNADMVAAKQQAKNLADDAQKQALVEQMADVAKAGIFDVKNAPAAELSRQRRRHEQRKGWRVE